MATTTTNPETIAGTGIPAWPSPKDPDGGAGSEGLSDSSGFDSTSRPSQQNALQALLAFSALHEQVRRRKTLAAQNGGFDGGVALPEFDEQEQFLLDEVLQLVAERAVAITGADGLAIALAENNEIVLRAAAGTVRPDVGARIDRDSAFSGACFQQAQVVICDDTETDTRVNLEACRKLGARSMVAVPLCGRRRVIGLLEAFSTWPFGFNDSDVRNLSLLAELVLGALKPEDEDRFAQSAQVAEKKLTPAPTPAAPVSASIPAQVLTPKSAVPPVIAAPAAKISAAPSVSAKPVQPETVAPPAAVVKSAPVQAAPPAVSPTTPPKIVDKPAAASALEAKVIESSVIKSTVIAPAASSAVEARSIDKDSAKEVETISASATAATASAPDVTFGQVEPARKTRPANLILLLVIVVGAAFAGGVWWKLKTAQLGSVMVHTEKMAKPSDVSKDVSKDVTKNAAKDASNQTLAIASPSPAPPALNSDAINDSAPDDSAPATAQELAKFPRVTGIRHWSSADSSTVVLDLEDQVQYEAHRIANPDRIYFDLHDTRLAAELIGKSIEIGDGLLNRVRVAQPVAGMTRIVLETKGNSNFSVSLEPNPYRLLVEVRKPGTAPKAVNLFPNAEAERKLLAIVVPPPTKEDLALRARVPKMRIVVDAGHGGWDLGTVGRRGLLEKDLVLEIATRLGKLLESRLGSDVIFTRPDDNYITLDDRAMIANQSQADLFVSVHANYSDLPSARGVETYYTNFFTAPGAKDAGLKDADARANSGTKPAPTLSATDLHERIEQSRRLAASVQRSLYGTLSIENPGLRDRGIKEAGFVVLTESAMPGILAEVSFVSSPTDEQKLRSDGYREEIAEALYKGIARYAAANSKNVKVASAAK
jgi:N-acetylmuramoyl-L-alanine amidase/putative methionine-R-sulfoxide reductase with GAF domain